MPEPKDKTPTPAPAPKPQAEPARDPLDAVREKLAAAVKDAPEGACVAVNRKHLHALAKALADDRHTDATRGFATDYLQDAGVEESTFASAGLVRALLGSQK